MHELLQIEQHENPQPRIDAAQSVCATAMKSNGDTRGQFCDEIMDGLQECGDPDEGNVEQ